MKNNSKFQLFVVIPTLLMPAFSFGQPTEVAKPLSQLKSYWHDTRIDFFETATDMGQHAATEVFSYHFSVDIAQINATPIPQTIPLELFWNESIQDNASVATPEVKEQLIKQGYELKATEGYIFTQQAKGTIPLKLFYHPQLKDYRVVTEHGGESDARENGYQLIGIEGYVYPPRH
ncbi:hypothetical protein FJ444_04435 [Aestuariibacter sp. GS-14]|uniref:hypothetical protein n=1 Tax=Aestuariibacter sp. GS-14 TaxID=2590670 RepID=UPI001129CC89|nr:hypothetical protein [Aestuariibacter sp. GS-14]TPV60874.1 hypothetical protein FJ444_04435 [Aestuariibacter sp. GS-14]